MADMVLKTNQLTKIYGKHKAVNGVDMNIKQGDIYGFIGRNGAGKTTLMRTVLGMTYPSGGSYELFDGMNPDKARKKVGCLIEHPSLYKKSSAMENMKRFSILFGGSSKECEEILDYVGLGNAKHKKVGAFSLGMRQRLGIAIAMIGNPEFLVLDEPINGLDPAGIKEVRDLILRLNEEKGITFLISSHLLDELSKVATTYGIIDNGTLLEEISATELEGRCQHKLIIEVDNPQKAIEVLKNIIPQEEIQVEDGKITLSSHIEESGEINQRLVAGGVEVTELVKKVGSLENYFIGRVGL